MLAIKGLPLDREPTVGNLTERLCVEPHTAVVLVDKVVVCGFAVRKTSDIDRRRVLVLLTEEGEKLLRDLFRRAS
ncbi:MAG: hypothetical protein KA712_10380 [Myxococcales bacterium]|nr:hypothetical protein [Myxococcales bacterium]